MLKHFTHMELLSLIAIGIAFILAGIALNIHARKNPLTDEEREQLEHDLQVW